METCKNLLKEVWNTSFSQEYDPFFPFPLLSDIIWCLMRDFFSPISGKSLPFDPYAKCVESGLVSLNGRVDSLPEDQYSDWFQCIYCSKSFFITPKAQKGIKGRQYLFPWFCFSPCLHQPQVLLLSCLLAIPWWLQVEKMRYASFLFILNWTGNPRPTFFSLFFIFMIGQTLN